MPIPPAFRLRKFRIYWVGTVFGWMGNQVLIWAIPWHIGSFTDNPFALGAIGLIRLAPTILISLFAGVIADSISRRKIVFLTQFTMGLIGLIYALLTWSGLIQLWHIYILLSIHATTYILGQPARYSMTPNLVSTNELANALSVEFLGLQIGSLLGPIVSGTVMEHFGQHAAYFTSAGLFGIMLISLLLLGPVPQEKIKRTSSAIDWDAIKTGIRYTFKHPLIFPSMLLDFLATFLTRADSLMSYFARDILGLNASQYGWLSAASAIGAVSSSLTLSQFPKIRRQGPVLIGSIGLIGVGAVVFGISRNFLLSMSALIVIGASDSISSIIRSSIRHSHTPDKLRGRMISVNQIFFSGGPYLGDVKSGFLGGVIGVPLAVALGGIANVFAVGWIASRWKELRAYDYPFPSKEG